MCRRRLERPSAGARSQERGENPHRLLRLGLRALARPLLSRGTAGVAMARSLRAVVRHGRGQRELLPPAHTEVGRALGRGDSAGVRLLGEGEPVPDAREAAARGRQGSRAALRADRASARCREARADPVAAPGALPPRRRAAPERPPGGPTRATFLLTPAPELVPA